MGRAILLFTFLGFITLMLYAFRHKKPESGNVLGEHTPDIIQTTDTRQNKGLDSAAISKAANDLLRQSGDTLREAANRSLQTVRDTVVERTVETVTKQIDKLPSEDQDKVKEYICR